MGNYSGVYTMVPTGIQIHFASVWTLPMQIRIRNHHTHLWWILMVLNLDCNPCINTGNVPKWIETITIAESEFRGKTTYIANLTGLTST